MSHTQRGQVPCLASVTAEASACAAARSPNLSNATAPSRNQSTTRHLFDGLPYFLLVMHRRSPAERPAAWAHVRVRWPVALLGTVASLGSYGIAPRAMTRAPVHVVAALGQTSVRIAAVIGARQLKEPFGARRAMGRWPSWVA